MTEVFVHGYLGQKYGKSFKFSLGKPKDVFRALDSMFDDFSKEIVELGKQGMQYSLVVDDKEIVSDSDLETKKRIKTIHIVPTIFGAGIGALVVGVIAAVGSYAAAGAGLAFLSSVLLSVAVSAISFGLQSLLSKPPSATAVSQSSPAASTASTNATSKSFLFSNRENVASQGNPVPLGYGRLRVGAAIIQENIKSYPNSISTFNEFASQSTQEGQSLMSVIHNQTI